MTAIAVRIYEEKIEISADSMISFSWWDKVEKSGWASIKDFSKLYQVNDMVVWFSWSVEDALVISEWMKTNLPKGSTIDYIESYILSVYAHLKSRNTARVPKLQLILIYNDKVFYAWDYLIYEVWEYEAIGSWMHYCRTAMYLWCDTKKAVSVACEFAWGVGGDIKRIVIDKVTSYKCKKK